MKIASAQPMPQKQVVVYRKKEEACGIRTCRYLFLIASQIPPGPFAIKQGYSLIAVKNLPKFASRLPLSSHDMRKWGELTYDEYSGKAESFSCFPREEKGTVFGIGSYLELLANNDLKRNIGIVSLSSTSDPLSSRQNQLKKAGIVPGVQMDAEEWMRSIASVVRDSIRKTNIQRSIENTLFGKFARLPLPQEVFENLAHWAVRKASRLGRLNELEVLVEKVEQ